MSTGAGAAPPPLVTKTSTSASVSARAAARPPDASPMSRTRTNCLPGASHAATTASQPRAATSPR